MTARELPVRFNVELDFNRFDFAQGFLEETQTLDRIFCGGRFSVSSSGHISPELRPGWPQVRLRLDPFSEKNLAVIQKIMWSTGQNPTADSEEYDLVLHCEDMPEPIVVTRRGKGFVFWVNHQASVQQ